QCTNDFHNIGGIDDDIPDDDTEVPNNISINNGNFYSLFGEDNVGIGTDLPLTKLNVFWNISHNHNTLPSYHATLEDDCSILFNHFSLESMGWTHFFDIAALRGGDGSSGGSALRLLTANNSGNVHSRLMINRDGEVGIGTDDPESKLDLSWNINHNNNHQASYFASLDNDCRILFNHFSLESMGWTHFFDIAALRGGDGSSGGSAIRLLTADNSGNVHSRLMINRDGEVGIGTDDPQNKLQVNGMICSTSGGYKFPDGSVQTTASIGSGSSYWSANGNHIYSNNSGNVGIHNSNPGNMLRISSEATSYSQGKALCATFGGSGDDETAIYGESTATSGGTVGVFGIVASPGSGAGSSCGIRGLAKSTNLVGGSGLGVYGRTNCITDSGTASISCGVFGQAPGAAKGRAEEHGGLAAGIIGETWSHREAMPGVYGVNNATSGATRGVWGEVHSPSGVALYGWEPSGKGFGVYSVGHIAAGKGYTISSVNDSTKGPIQTYAQESPELWIEDFGEGKLDDGYSSINIDQTFLETVTVDSENPIKVFIQLNDDCNGVYVKRGDKSFEVIELQGGKSDAEFTYRIVAKKKGHEKARYESCNTAITQDPYYNPNLNERLLKSDLISQ
ncbi:hypothetical protein JW979_03270, partial [bacterium]|nr:hypothetical protein [candidate division CSSED10-310 bacterium]